MSLQKRYRDAEKVAGADPFESGLLGSLADNECKHGRLSTDPTRRCGCWREEGAVLKLLAGQERTLTPRVASEVQVLRRLGLSTGAIMVVLNRYFGVELTYHQIQYHLSKAGVVRPKTARGEVVA